MVQGLILLGFLLGSPSAASGGGQAAPAKAAKPFDAYAVLKSVPAPPRAGCSATPTDGGEFRASLWTPATGECPVARVAEDEIPLSELANALAAAHMEKGSKALQSRKPAGMDFSTTLERIIDLRLVTHEAVEMGLTELPEYRDDVAAFRASTLRTTLQKQAAANAKSDRAEVDRLVRAAAREWKVRSVLFEKEEDAKAFRAAVAKGGSFDALARAAVKEGKGRGGEPGYVSVQQMLPELAVAADALKKGQVSPPVKVSNGFVVLKLEGMRYPDNKQAREQAEARSLAEQQHKAIRAFHESLVKKYAKVDEKLLQSLDFEAGGDAGFQALLKDARPLAEIQGEKPITVGELAKEISKKFFHGIADPIKEKRVNKQKIDTFEVMLGSRLFAIEARARKLDQTPAFKRQVAEHERVLAFNLFLERAIIPGVKVSEAEVAALYEKRKAQFSSPLMYKLDGLGFGDAKTAQATFEKVTSGTDVEWLRANAAGQLPLEKRRLALDGALVSVNTLPPSLAKALTGARPGDYRLYATDDGKQHYVVRVVDVVPPGVRPYVDVREPLAREVEAQKITASLKDYIGSLRKAQKVDVIITRIGT